jgi:DNA-binding NarL/FixJ family response regulator
VIGEDKMNSSQKNSETQKIQEEQYKPDSNQISFVETKLTTRELEVLELVGQGKTNFQIGELLNISHRTVRGHLEHIMRKLRVGNRTEAIFIARKSGILKLPEI